MRAFARTAFIVAVCLPAAVLACSDVIGIRERPLRRDASGAISDADLSDSGAVRDAGGDGGCSDDPALGCRSGCPHAFCADFDRSDALPNDWISVISPTGAPIYPGLGARGATIGLSEQALSRPFGLASAIDFDAGYSYVVVARALTDPGDASLGGVRLSYFVRPGVLELLDNRGPLDGGAAFSGAVVAGEAPLRGVMLLMNRRGVFLLSNGRDILDDLSDAATVAPVFEGSIRSGTFLKVELYAATRAVALREGISTCENQPEGVVLAARVANATGCLGAPAELSDLAWVRSSAILIGTGSFGGSKVDFTHDNVIADFLEE